MKLSLVNIAVLAFSTAAFAQTAAPAPQNIDDHKENQQDRITQGVQSGQLTAGETTKLQKNEASINKEERNMKSLDDGKLTSTDRAALKQQQNGVSKQIFADKHNTAAQPKASGLI